jgi:predicted naringenin-chalcone synthase
MTSFLSDFRVRRPAHESTQEQSFEWLAQAHARARVSAGAPEADAEKHRLSMIRRLGRFGCPPAQIATRGHVSEDCAHLDWAAMEVYRVAEDPAGAGAGRRGEVYARAVEAFFADLYADVSSPPAEMVHVTCTGYVSPSGAQRLVAAKGWGQTTRVTHAYHMGCYAALPAVRLARGQLELSGRPGARIDIVHTELCTLHLDPTATTPEQIVVQSLFADGIIAYSVVRDRPRGPTALEVLSQREEIVPDSTESMAWAMSDHAMRMTLGRDVPARLAAVLPDFLDRLFGDAGLSFDQERARSVFAVHPGGPRILDEVQSQLALAPEQIAASRAVLRAMGNMSSATLPHVWQAILADPRVAPGTLVASLAFGPGLSCAGAILRKEHA